MYFNHPFFLLLLTFPLALFLYSLRPKKQTLSSTFSPAILKTISVNFQLVDKGLKYKLFLFVTVLLIITLAQPVLNHSSLNRKKKNIPLVIALDISKSMLKDDLYPSRLEFALSKIKTIMQSDSNLRVGLLLFANNAYVAHPLSEDKSSVLFISKNIDYSKVMENRTNLFAALEGAILMLKDYKRKNLLILSDIGSLEGFNDESEYIKDYNLSVNIMSISATSTYSSDDINVVLKKLQKNSQEVEEKDNKTTTIQLFYFPLALALFLLLFIYTYALELKNKSVNLLVSLFILSLTTQTKASVLDFHHLSNAESSFKEAQYTNALISYNKLSQTQDILYNIANTQYKLGLYHVAIKNYMKSLNTDDVFNAKVYYNVANAYVKLDKLHLAKKYYKKSLNLVQDIQAQENLKQVLLVLSNQRHKDSKEDKYKLPERISVKKKSPQKTLSSDYIVRLDKIVLSEEEKILKALKNRKPIIFLRKLDIHRRSKNVLQD